MAWRKWFGQINSDFVVRCVISNDAANDCSEHSTRNLCDHRSDRRTCHRSTGSEGYDPFVAWINQLECYVVVFGELREIYDYLFRKFKRELELAFGLHTEKSFQLGKIIDGIDVNHEISEFSLKKEQSDLICSASCLPRSCGIYRTL